MTTSLGPGPGPSDWLALPKGDEYEHSQNMCLPQYCAAMPEPGASER